MAEATTTLSTGNVGVTVTVSDNVTEAEDTPTKEDIPQAHIDDSIARATALDAEHKVAGYGRSDDGYGGPYHPDAFLNPQVERALAGTAEAAAKYQDDLAKLDKAASKDGCDKVDLVAGSAHTTIVETAPFRAAHATPELEATEDNVAEAAARKHLIVPKSNESDKDINSRAFEQAPAKEPKESKAAREDADTRPVTPGAEAQGSSAQAATRNDPGEPQKSEGPTKRQPTKQTTAKKSTAKKTTTRKNVKASK